MMSTRCSICDGALRFAFSTRDYNRRTTSDRFTYLRCSRCGTLTLSSIPADLGRYYPADYYGFPRSREELLAAADHERYKLEIVRSFAPPGRLIEIGPAAGAFAVVAQEAGYEVSAIEMDSDCCRFLRTVVGIEVHETDDPVAALGTEEQFDVVAMWHVLEHVPNPREVLAAAARALLPGGVVAIAAPNPNAFQFRVLRSRWTHVDAPRHLFLVPFATLARLGRELELEVAVLTTVDPGTLGWNAFGWQESLAGLGRTKYVRHGLRLVGKALAATMRPFDRHDHHGSTYTIVLRRPSERATVGAPMSLSAVR